MDEATLRFYRGHAEAYAAREISLAWARLESIPLAASTWCCHPRTRMRRRRRHRGNAGAGRRPISDGRARGKEGVASRRLGRPVGTLLFHDIDAVGDLCSVWANACLLHVPRLAMVLSLIWRAPRTLLATFKTTAESASSAETTITRRRVGCARPTPGAGNWNSLEIETGEVIGFDNQSAPMLTSRRKSP